MNAGVRGPTGRALQWDLAANLLGKTWAVAAVYLFVPQYVARLGVEAYGLIAFNAVALAALVLADAGLSATMTRQAARERDLSVLAAQLRVVERVLLGVVGLGGLLLATLAPILADRWIGEARTLPPQQVLWSLRLMALGLVPQVAISLYLGVLMGRQRQVAANAWNAAFILVRSGLVLLPLAWRPEITVYFAWQAFASWTFLGLFRAVALRELGGAATPAARDWGALRELSVYASGMFAMGLISAVTTQLDRVVVSMLRPLGEFSLYALAATVAQVPTLIAVPVAATLLPRLTAAVAEGGVGAARPLYERGSFVIASLAGAAGASVILFAHELIALWLRDAALSPLVPQVTALLAVGGVALALQLMPFQLSLAHGHTATNIRLGLGVLAVAVPLQWVLTVRYGIVGAAIPWVCSGVFGAIFLGVRLNRLLRSTPADTWFLICCALPLTICAAILGVGRGVANVLHAGPFAAVGVATASGLLALAACWAVSGQALAFVARRPAVVP